MTRTKKTEQLIYTTQQVAALLFGIVTFLIGHYWR